MKKCVSAKRLLEVTVSQFYSEEFSSAFVSEDFHVEHFSRAFLPDLVEFNSEIFSGDLYVSQVLNRSF